MVTVKDFKVIAPITEGAKQFNVLVLESQLELVKSKTGKYYGAMFKTQLPVTFDEKACKKLIGKEIPGRVVKVSVEPYPFKIKDTGETVILDYSYQYQEETSAEAAVFA